jgi:hypothetical protein
MEAAVSTRLRIGNLPFACSFLLLLLLFLLALLVFPALLLLPVIRYGHDLSGCQWLAVGLQTSCRLLARQEWSTGAVRGLPAGGPLAMSATGLIKLEPLGCKCLAAHRSYTETTLCRCIGADIGWKLPEKSR